VIIDVRSAMEYKSGRIPGAKHIPFWALLYRYKELQNKKDKLLVLCCEHGPRAWIAKAILLIHGFKNLDCLSGHMKKWKKDGSKMEKI